MTLEGRRIALATPMYNNMCVGDYVESVIGLQAALWAEGATMGLIRLGATSDVAMARNLSAALFLQTDCTDLLFVDADMGFDPLDLIRMLRCGRDVIGAICPGKGFDWKRLTAMAARNPAIAPAQLEASAPRFGTFRVLAKDACGGIPLDREFPVAGIGSAIMAIKRSVFGALREAFPKRRIAIAGNHKLAPLFAPGTPDMGTPFEHRFAGGEAMGEDMAFCADWRSLGGEVFACPWFTVRHVGNYAFTSNLRAIAAGGGVIEISAESPPTIAPGAHPA